VRLHALAADIVELPADEIILIELSSVYLDSRYPVPTGFLPSGKPDPEDLKRYLGAAIEIFRLVATK
jgi:hypothetical protein